MLGGKHKQPLGYTIIEVMIVLAVSGVMFVIAANFINGKQAKTSFTTGVNELASKIQDTIEQVNDGRYADSLLNCTGGAGSISFPGSTAAQGTNSGCIFLGKLIQFRGTSYRTILLAGSRLNSSNVPSTSLIDAGAKAIPLPGGYDDKHVPQDLTIKSVKINGALSASTTIGFIQSLASLDSTSHLASGSQTISLYTVRAMGAGVNDYSLVVGGNINQANSAAICVADSIPGSRFAEIQLGGTDTYASNLSVRVKMLGTTSC